MHLEGTYVYSAPRSIVWETLLDPTAIARALPGGEQLEQVGPTDYKAVMNVRVGPVQGKFEGKISLSDIVDLAGYTMKVDGQGTPGFVAGEGMLALEDHETGGTLLRYTGDVQVGGRIAGVGQRLLESTAKSVTRQGLATLDELLRERMAPPAALPATEPGDEAAAVASAQPTPIGWAPVQTPVSRPAGDGVRGPTMAGMTANVARDVASDLAADYIPVDKQERVFFFALGALAMLLFVLLVRLVQRD
jgi:hypothetical protein